MDDSAYLEILLSKKSVRKETLRLGMYLLIKLIGKEKRVLLKQERMAEFLETKQSNISRSIKELVALGFISRKPSGEDARRMSYALKSLKGLKPAAKADARATVKVKAKVKAQVRAKARNRAG